LESKDTPDHRSLGDLWSEVKGQITGSDIESGYSYLYTWLTNQFGHFMIGFAGTILFGWLLMGGLGLAFSGVDYRWFWPWAGIAVAVVWFVIWLFKEWMVDVASALRDLHFAQRQRRALRNRQTFTEERAGYIWPKRIDWENVRTALRKQYFTRDNQKTAADRFRHGVVRDSQMDIRCYLAGTLTAVAMYVAPGLATKCGAPALTVWMPLLTLVTVLIFLVFRSKDWLWANIAFDKAQLPFVSRFVLNAQPFEETPRKDAFDFATRKDGKPGHLIIIGPPKSGRTTTAVALGVEALLETLPPRNVVVYTTLCKLLDRVAEKKPSGPPGERPVWPPEDAELLIVDDVGAQSGKGALITHEQFEWELRDNDQLRGICGGKHVIWVVGDDPNRSEEWNAAIQEAFTHRKKDEVERGKDLPRMLTPIKLPEAIPQKQRLPLGQQWAKMGMSAYRT
jgi:hypothetical protein